MLVTTPLKAPLNLGRLLLKAVVGAYRQDFPLRYEIYAGQDDESRTAYTASGGTFRWADQPR